MKAHCFIPPRRRTSCLIVSQDGYFFGGTPSRDSTGATHNGASHAATTSAPKNASRRAVSPGAAGARVKGFVPPATTAELLHHEQSLQYTLR